MIRRLLICLTSLVLLPSVLQAAAVSEVFARFCASPTNTMSRFRLLNEGTNGLNDIVAYVLGHAPAGREAIALARGLDNLDADAFEVREQAEASLSAMGEVARADLLKLAAGDDPELSQRATAALTGIDRALFTTDVQRLRVYQALHALLLQEWPRHELRAACVQHAGTMQGVTRFMHPMEREILAVFLAANLSAPANVEPVLSLAHGPGPAAGVAARVLLGGLSHLYADGFPARWRTLELPERSGILKSLVKTKNPDVAQALLWGVRENQDLYSLRQAGGKRYSHDVTSVPYIYQVFLWHRAEERLGKTSLIGLYRDFNAGPEALMHLWARLGDAAWQNKLKRFESPVQAKIDRLLSELREPENTSKDSSVAQNELYVWRGPIPGEFCWFQHTALEPLDGQLTPVPSVRNQNADSDYYGVVYYDDLAPGHYRFRVVCGAQEVSQHITIGKGVNVAFLPAPKTYADHLPDTLAHRGFAREYRLAIDLEGLERTAPARVVLTHKGTGREVVMHMPTPGALPLRNVGRGRYRIEAEAGWRGGRITIEPGTLVLPLPMRRDETIRVPGRRALLVGPQGANEGGRLVLSGVATIGKDPMFSLQPETGEQSLVVTLSFGSTQGDPLTVWLPQGRWNASWVLADDAERERLAPVVITPGDTIQRVELSHKHTQQD